VLDLKSEGKPDVGMETLTWIHTHKTAALLKAAVSCGAVRTLAAGRAHSHAEGLRFLRSESTSSLNLP